ncbi:MAG: NUDIX hydrolase [Acidimicrobiia bacterium]|jgi:ADP-ribose pyrophosphatase YjhB (NUDIX family)|nr:NUDIX hydrolase [Acidimicrobiia bacterium]MBP8179597.1 NUDIX hydrolase [Acidimicrobiia bacterium]
MTKELRRWLVAGGLIEQNGKLLLVKNVRKDGRVDWTPPGGVIDDDDPSTETGLTREVFEETGLEVSAWTGPAYTVEVAALDMGWEMHCQVYVADAVRGDINIEDPDGIVVEARWVPLAEIPDYVRTAPPWVRGPLTNWTETREAGQQHHGFHLTGRRPGPHSIRQVHP